MCNYSVRFLHIDSLSLVLIKSYPNRPEYANINVNMQPT